MVHPQWSNEHFETVEKAALYTIKPNRLFPKIAQKFQAISSYFHHKMRQYQRVNKGITLEFLESHQVVTHSGKSKMTLTVPVPLSVTGYVLREDVAIL